MKQFKIGDRVRVDIPEKDDPDHERLRQKHGTVLEILEDNAGQETGDVRNSYLFSVEIDDDSIENLRWRGLRPI